MCRYRDRVMCCLLRLRKAISLALVLYYVLRVKSVTTKAIIFQKCVCASVCCQLSVLIEQGAFFSQEVVNAIS